MKNVRRILVSGAGAMIVALALTGCGSTDATGDRTAGRVLDDRQITERVEEALQDEPMYKFTEVDVRTFNGVVQLSGFATSEEQKRRAGEIAQRIQGVTQVANNITLKPAGNLTPTGRTDQPQ